MKLSFFTPSSKPDLPVIPIFGWMAHWPDLNNGTIKRVRICPIYSKFAHLSLIWLLGCSLGTGTSRAASQYEGQTISAVTFDPPEQPVDSRELEGMVPKTGSPLRIADVRRSIERLFSTGRYQDIQVNAEASGAAQVALRFVTKNSWFIGHVSVSGKVSDPPNPGQLVNATRLDLGEPFHQEDVKTAVANVTHLLMQNGFYEVTVTPKLDYSPVAQQVDINFEIATGKRARFWVPQLTGNLQLSEKKIIRATKWKRWFGRGWQPITQARVRDGLEGVRSKFEKSDRLLATVELESLNYDAANNRSTPHLEIQAGPQVQIKAVGAKVKRKVLEQNVPVFQEHTVDNDLLEEGRRHLQEEFQAKGYFEAEVQFKEQHSANGREEIDYLITPGERHSFVKLTIEGNKYFQTETIRERLFVQPKSLQFRRGRYSEVFTRRDRESIVNLYKSNGFRDVVVTAIPQDDYQGKEGNVALTLKIEEGPQYLVSHLDITGGDRINLGNIRPTLSSVDDQPFSEFSVASDRDTILSYYFEHGFPNASFEYTIAPGPDPHLINVQYRVREGNQQFVRQVITSGLNHTKDKLVERNISMQRGDPLSPVQMSDIQKRLYDLGVFAKVDMAIQNSEGTTENKYVLYDMEEARRYSVTVGFGAQIANIGGSNAAQSLSDPAGSTGFSPRVSLDLTRINFLGIGHTIRFSTRYSSLDRRGLIDYLAPRIFNNEKLNLNFTVLYSQSNDVRTFASTRKEASVQLTDRFSKSLTGFLRFTYRDAQVSNLKISPLLLPRVAQSVRIGILSANFIQDRRDDPTDAHKGIYNTLDLGLASGAFGSQANFFRLLAKNATYHPIGRKLVLARQTQFGMQPAFGKTANVSTANGNYDLDPIPLPERFYGGGGNSMRGFPENQAGPRDLQTGFALGGSALFFNTTELRFPILGDNISGVIFHDFGNTFSRLSDFSFRVKQNDLTDFSYMVHAVGFGIRYRTPIGPVRLDLADSINSPRFNGFGGTYEQLILCSINNNCVQAVQRVSRFQFFFSIGQAF